MLKLTSPNLPTTPVLPFEIAPTLTIFNGAPRHLPPAFRFSKSPEGPIPDELQGVGLGYPDYSGYLFKLSPGFTISSIAKLYTTSVEFNQVNTPYKTIPVSYWVYQDSVYLYAERAIVPPGTDVEMDAIAQTTLPSPTSNTYTIDLSSWDTFTASSIYTAGVTFTLATNPLSPQPGEFTQSSGTVVLYGSNAIAPPAFSTALVTLTKTFADPIPYLSVATFDLTEEQVFYVDGADYLGLAFAPTPNAYTPTLNQFFWSTPWLTLFLDVRSLVVAKSSVLTAKRIVSQSISSITYDSGGG